jgi:hypothetical protein
MSGGHTIERKALVGGAGGAMRVCAGEAHQFRVPEARAGRGKAALAAGSGWAGHDEAIQTCAGRAVGVRQALMAAEQEERRVPARAWRACAVHVVGKRACAGCGLSRRVQERAAPIARVPCATLRVPRAARFRAAQGSTGNTRAARPGATRAAQRAHDAALFREGARGAAPRREGARRRVKKKQ